MAFGKRLLRNSKNSIKTKLDSLNLRPRKSRGQNFLSDPGILERIVNFSEPQFGSKIVEIGPGLGALTAYLAKLTEDLTVIELQSEFCDELNRSFAKIKIINQDILSVDFSTLGDNLIVYGNIPYNISTDIIFHLIRYSKVISRATLVLQREFARRLCAKPNTKEYGSISVALQLRANLKLGFEIQGGAFTPPANVDSALLRIDFYKKLPYPIEDQRLFERIVRASFSHRRKKLANSLKYSGMVEPALVEPALKLAGVDGTLRAETLDLADFYKLYRGFSDVFKE
ncbi:MAG TPA: 16S rRNA (adenine(1518)-N(6)/adenine(1519)-N(6))-dimethyltransferase RsmA [Oligoflexia bacterium]|nr:16S rRNA (adenine(1518)-N(6)/adenine(1519)-N(6))-dimethyltransferase RsmA [Oligoflexia bacterium]HMP27116.1 16S rRNA (adenine(1518)-N(6)/adenine(1519)-N(6))-dimethyltransferase RsmA [Oligoflexia bacterium]